MSEIVCIYGSEAALMAELYREVGAIRKLKHAPTILTLGAEWKKLAKAARDDGNVDLLERLTEAKNARKAALARCETRQKGGIDERTI